MNTTQVAQQYIEFCKKGETTECLNTLYSPTAVSYEPKGAPTEMVNGIEGIRNKQENWRNSVEEVHNMEISEPLVAGNHFSCTMQMDVTYKGQPRSQFEEVCVFEVENGKIVNERFFYNVPVPQEVNN